MNIQLIPMEKPFKGYRFTSSQTSSVFSVWDWEGKIFSAPFGVRCPVERLGTQLEVGSLEEGVVREQKKYEEFFHAEVLFVLSIRLHELQWQLTSSFEEGRLCQTDFFERFSLLDFQRSRGKLPDWVLPFLEKAGCITHSKK